MKLANSLRFLFYWTFFWSTSLRALHTNTFVAEKIMDTSCPTPTSCRPTITSSVKPQLIVHCMRHALVTISSQLFLFSSANSLQAVHKQFEKTEIQQSTQTFHRLAAINAPPSPKHSNIVTNTSHISSHLP